MLHAACCSRMRMTAVLQHKAPNGQVCVEYKYDHPLVLLFYCYYY